MDLGPITKPWCNPKPTSHALDVEGLYLLYQSRLITYYDNCYDKSI